MHSGPSGRTLEAGSFERRRAPRHVPLVCVYTCVGVHVYVYRCTDKYGGQKAASGVVPQSTLLAESFGGSEVTDLGRLLCR